MASTINADNGVVSGSSGLKSTADTSGVLALQSNGTTGLTLNTSLALGVGSSPSYGSSGQVLTSSGSGAAPTWAAVNIPSTPINSDLSLTEYTLTMPTTLVSSFSATPRMQAVALTATTEMILYYQDLSLQAVVYNSSTGTFGTPVLVRSANLARTQDVACIAMSSTQVLVSSLPAGTTSLQTVVLSVSGSTITVNTSVSTTLANNANLLAANTRYVKVGSSYVLHYSDNNSSQLRILAVTVSGTTPTLGAEYNFGSSDSAYAHSYAYSSSILLCIYYGSVSLNASPFTISGTTITLGTAATTTSDSNIFCTGMLSTGNVAIIYRYNSATVYAGVISVSGTTASISVAADTLTFTNYAPVMQVFGNQAFIVSGRNAGVSDQISVLTDTAGAAFVGTPLQNFGPVVGYLSSGKLLTTAASSNTSATYVYGISTYSPVLEKALQGVSTANSGTTSISASGYYVPPLAGPPNSGNGTNSLTIRTSAGKMVNAQTTATPFCVSLDGVSVGKYQYSVNFYNSSWTDALSGDTAWSIQLFPNTTTTSLTLRKIKLS